MISVVIPAYNEEARIAGAVAAAEAELAALPGDFELIAVNDGSRDGTAAALEALKARHPRLRVLSNPVNRGRGHALRAGIAASRGDIVLATEADGSWRPGTLAGLAQRLRGGGADAVFASPYLPGGGYAGVPLSRRLVSAAGNLFARLLLGGGLTMYTGMTRGYRGEVIRSLPLRADGKVIHLEIADRLLRGGHAVAELPSAIAWDSRPRVSSTKVFPELLSHASFCARARPWRAAAAALAAGSLYAFALR